MIEITAQQELELRAGGWPARAVNPRTREQFVLLPVEMYERVRAILEDEDEISAVREMYPLVQQVVDADEGAVIKESA